MSALSNSLEFKEQKSLTEVGVNEHKLWGISEIVEVGAFKKNFGSEI